jgi:hypothetical protein
MTIKAHKFKPGELVQYHEGGELYVGVVLRAWDSPRRGMPPQFTVMWAGTPPGKEQESIIKQVSLRKYKE